MSDKIGSYIELISKTSGKNIFEEQMAWIRAEEVQEYVLVSEKDAPHPGVE